MSRLLGSVRAKATLGATVVVALALVAAGAAVLLSLRANLNGQAGTAAERSAREVAADLPGGASYDRLRLDDDQRPVQVVDEKGDLVAAGESLRRISGTGTGAVKPRPRRTAAAGSGGDAADDHGGGKDGDDHGGDGKGGDVKGGDGRGRGAGADDDNSLEPGRIGAAVSFGEGSATLGGDTADYRFAAVEVSVRSKGVLTCTPARRSPPNRAPYARP
ncbi:hypothetical protein ACWD7F_00205 [Streptomyces sp. NPDC005122]